MFHRSSGIGTSRKGTCMRRTSLLIVVIAAISAITTPGIANASSSDQRVVVNFEDATTLKATARPVNAQKDDPPGGGCSGEVGFNTTATYVNAVLVDTETPYHSSVTCDITASGQTMRHIFNVAELYINNQIAEPRAWPSECSHELPGDPPCLYGTSSANSLCLTITMRCDGWYHVVGGYTLLLPEGWIWTRWPSTCILLHESELSCTLSTPSRYVSPVY